VKNTNCQEQIEDDIEEDTFSFSIDGWTSIANVDYETCTTDFIDPATWKLH